MNRSSSNAYDWALGLREVETAQADTFEAEFPIVTGRPVQIVSFGESPDRLAVIDGIETGLELTAIKAGDAYEVFAEIRRLANKKHISYARRGIFDGKPMILLGTLDWPAPGVEGPGLYDIHQELAERIYPGAFAEFAFSEIWLMDSGPKYTSRTDPRTPADFFCCAPDKRQGFLGESEKAQTLLGDGPRLLILVQTTLKLSTGQSLNQFRSKGPQH